MSLNNISRRKFLKQSVTGFAILSCYNPAFGQGAYMKQVQDNNLKLTKETEYIILNGWVLKKSDIL